MFRPSPNPAKNRSQPAPLSALLADIDALRERVLELAYYQFERPWPSTAPDAPPSPSPSGIPGWCSQRSVPMQDQPPLYTCPPRLRYERGPASPAPVFRRRGAWGARGAHGTPRVTRTAPERRGRGVGRKRKRVRGNRGVEEETAESGSASEESEESEEDGDGDGEMQDTRGDGGRRDGRGGRFGGRGVAV